LGTDVYRRRVESLAAVLDAGGVDALVVTNPVNQRYLTGFTGGGSVLVGRDGSVVILTSFLGLEQAGTEAPGVRAEMFRFESLGAMKDLFLSQGCRRVAFESDYVTCARQQEITDRLGEFEWVPRQALVEDLRLVKDEAEIELMRRAAAATDAALAFALEAIRPGVTERQVALALEEGMRRAGAEGPAFETIVLFGARASLPHGRPGETRLEGGDWVLMDFGACCRGYAADMTRTLVCGRASDEQRRVYERVLEAQLAGLEAVRPGRTGREADAVAREILNEAGYEAEFGHSLGHGIGLEVHERPTVGPQGAEELRPGMMVTVEPGVYFRGAGGVRIEDTVLVTSDGCEALTHSGKELLEL